MSTLVNKRLVWTSPQEKVLQIDEVPVPEPPQQGAIVKVRYTGVCHTDLHNVEDNYCPSVPFPRVLGHEIAGHVHSLGGQTKPGVKVGEAVMVYGPVGCRTCHLCRGGHARLCESRAPEMAPFYGMCLKDGGFQHYVVIEDVEDLIKVDKNLPLDVACLLPCGGLAAFNALTTIKDSIDLAIKYAGKATLLVIGAGGLGLWAVLQARAIWPKHLQIAVADILEEKLKLSKDAGADVTILLERDGSVEDLAQKIRKACGGGVDGSVDFVNNQTTMGMMIHASNMNCTIALIGCSTGAVMYPADLTDIACRSLNIRGVIMGTKQQLIDLQHLVVRNEMKVLLNHVTLDGVNEVFKRLRSGTQPGRAVIDMQK